MNIKQSLEKIKFDTRMQPINLKNGSISEQDLKKHLLSLPDSENSAESFKVEDIQNDFDDQLS